MRLLPRTLLWRTILLIAVLLIVSQIAWFQMIRLTEREPRAKQVAQQIVGVVNLVRASLISVQPSKRRDFLIELSEREGIRVYPSDPDEQTVKRTEPPIMHLIRAEVRRQLGENTELTTYRQGYQAVWVSFTIDDDKYWVAIPRARVEKQFPWQWAGWATLVMLLSIAGAYWIVSRINRPLKHLAKAAGEIGKGEIPALLEENGPAEIRTLSHAFNQMNHDLQRLNADRALLLAGVSHDLRTPLSRLRLAVDMMGSNADASMQEGMVQDIEDIDAIINQFLDFARDGENEATQQGDLNQLIMEICQRFARHGHTIKSELAPLPALSFRPMAMHRLVTNLIDNALHYGKKDVEIHTWQENGKIIISVLDRGPGIPESDAERLLRPFTRLDPSRTGKSGSGLGLAIVDRVAKLHGGEIRLLPREGGGLEARVELPA